MRFQQVVRSTIAALFFVLPVQLVAQPAYKHPESGYRFPERLHMPYSVVFFRIKIEQYADKRLGVLVSYQNESLRCFASFYLYTLGLAHIPDGPESEPVNMQFPAEESNIFEYGRQANYTDHRRTSLPGSTMQASPQTPLFRMSTFEYVRDGEPRISWLLLTGTRHHFLKIRYTCLATSPLRIKGAKVFLERLITSFFEENAD
jgi:hypothetical protein